MKVSGKGWEMHLGKHQDITLMKCDHVITDPPFDAATHRFALTQSDKRDSALFGVSFAPVDAKVVALELIEMSSGWVIAFCAVEQLGEYREAVGYWPDGGCYMRGGVWTKQSPVPQISGDRPAMWGEAIAIMHSRDTRPAWNRGGKAGRWHGDPDRGKKLHPTQKPNWLMRQLVEDFTQPGETVLDPYTGSGATGVACLLTGRRFVGVEMNKEYFEIACESLRGAENGVLPYDQSIGQRGLFGANDNG